MPPLAQASIFDFIPAGLAPPVGEAYQQDKKAQFEEKFELDKIWILGVPGITVASPL